MAKLKRREFLKMAGLVVISPSLLKQKGLTILKEKGPTKFKILKKGSFSCSSSSWLLGH